MFQLIFTLFDALLSNWKGKLIGISSDGAFNITGAIDKHHKEFKMSFIIWNAMAHMCWVYKMTIVMLILPICASPVICIVLKSTLQHCQNDNPAPMYVTIIENYRKFPTEIRYCLELIFSPLSTFPCSWKMLKALTVLFKLSSSLSGSVKSLPMIVSTIDLSISTFKLTLEAFVGWKVVSFEAKKCS